MDMHPALLARLSVAASERTFREFIGNAATQQGKWKLERTRELNRLQHAPPGESHPDTERRWAAGDAIESDPNFHLAAVADDPRLTLESKCALLAAWWFANQHSRALCPQSESAGVLSPLNTLLTIMDINADMARVDFTDIGAVAGDVLDAYALKSPKPLDGGCKDCMTWQEAGDKADERRLRGERFTSYPKMAKDIGCSSATLHKAITENGCVELQEWASKQRGASRLNAGPKVANAAFANTPQAREPDPADVLEDADIDEAMTYLLDQAAPNERERINTMTPAEKRQLAETVYRDPDKEEQVLRQRKAKHLRRH